MTNKKDIRWKQRFENFEKAYRLLERTVQIKKPSEVEKAIIFGSRAMGNHKKGSDIDLAIAGQKVNETICNKISSQLNEEDPIPFFVEVINYKNIKNQALKEHIQNHGIIIYQKSSVK